jgi:hypothetical protein
MKVFFFDYMNSLTDLHEYMTKNPLHNTSVYFSDTLYTTKHDKTLLLKKTMRKINQLGFNNVLSSLALKNSIILAAGVSNFYKYLSRKVVLFDHGWGIKRTPGNLKKKTR